MKRFYKDVATVAVGDQYVIQLDGRTIRTQGGDPQLLPTAALAEKLADEWRAQGEDINPASFHFRDMADYSVDVIAKDKDDLVDKLLGYAETDTLCYRADPDEPLYRRQHEVWEPILTQFETREGVEMQRVSGVLHRPQSPETLARLRTRLEALDPFTLAALEQLTSLSASLCLGLEALRDDADGDSLWNAANLEEDWQADLWGKDWETEERRVKRRGDFLAAMEFAKAARE